MAEKPAPTFDELYEINPAFRRFTDLISAEPGGRVDLGEIWEAGGARRGRSPRHWWSRFCRRFAGDVEDEGERLLADEGAALHYLQWIDRRVLKAVQAEFVRKMRANPLRNLLGCPDPLMGSLAVAAVASGKGVGIDEAKRALVKGAVEATEGLDDLERESRVAEVQRAVGRVQDAG
jgi:hypothetical protein